MSVTRPVVGSPGVQADDQWCCLRPVVGFRHVQQVSARYIRRDNGSIGFVHDVETRGSRQDQRQRKTDDD